MIWHGLFRQTGSRWLPKRKTGIASMPKINLFVLGAIAAFAFSISAAEEPPKAEAKEPAPEAEKKAATETPAAQPAPTTAGPKFPLQSEWFIHIADLQPDDKTVGDVEEAQQLEHHALEDILVALKA